MSSITIFINSKATQIPSLATVEHVVQQRVDDSRPFAIAINGRFIPKSHYCETVLNNEDHIELLHPMQGG